MAIYRAGPGVDVGRYVKWNRINATYVWVGKIVHFYFIEAMVVKYYGHLTIHHFPALNIDLVIDPEEEAMYVLAGH